jgi:hypothetical protein
MNRKRVVTVALLIAAAIFSGCGRSSNVQQPSNVVGIDMQHGQAWEGLAELLTEGGLRMVLLDNPMDPESLRPLGALIIADATKPFSGSEVRAISKYVRNGGGLLCAGQAWSWVTKEYGNKPIETFPLNQLGAKMNFWITGQNVGAPKYLKTGIMAGVGEVQRVDWWPSEVELRSKDGSAIVRDERQRILGGSIPFGNGRIVVYGHGGLLKDNPQVLKNTLLYLTKQP